MPTALSLMIATYILVRVRYFDQPPAERTRADYWVLQAAELFCLGCWLVVVWKALYAAVE